jgi:hypothetical protein
LADLPRLLVTADAHLVTLRPQFAGIVLPSKIYACIASRRPILFVGPETSDVHLLADHSGLPYRRIQPGDEASFASALDAWSKATPDAIEEDQDQVQPAYLSRGAVA